VMVFGGIRIKGGGERIYKVVDRGSSPIVCSDVLSGGEAVVSILYGGCYLRFTLSSENSAHTCDSPMSPHMPYTSVHALERS